jgi:hypothetical protein
MYIFGGYDGITRLNDIFIFHFEQDMLEVPKSTILTELGELVGSHSFSDVTFQLAEGKTIPAHKLLLSRSQYFRAMFTHEMKEKD